MKKKTNERNLAYNSYGYLNSKSGLYEITFDFSNDMQHFNGEYSIAVHVADINAVSSINWDIGTVQVWFKEGQDEGNNLGINEQYLPKPIITHIFPPEEPQKSWLVSFIVFNPHFIATCSRCQLDNFGTVELLEERLCSKSKPWQTQPHWFRYDSKHYLFSWL